MDRALIPTCVTPRSDGGGRGVLRGRSMASIDRRDYATLYGPTTGDAVRLGDTALIAVVENDHAIYGDECLHGGGKTLSHRIGRGGIPSAEGAVGVLVGKAAVV